MIIEKERGRKKEFFLRKSNSIYYYYFYPDKFGENPPNLEKIRQIRQDELIKFGHQYIAMIY
jgi:hypothetical protein